MLQIKDHSILHVGQVVKWSNVLVSLMIGFEEVGFARCGFY